MATNKNPELLYPELSYKITGACFETHNELGRFAREKQYGGLLEIKMMGIGLTFTREQRVGDSGNILDFVIEGLVALELKAKGSVVSEDYRQVQNYLQASQLKLGLLVNFRDKYLKPIRIVKIEGWKKRVN